MQERELDEAHLPPLTVPDLSPEARRKRASRWGEAYHEHVGPHGKFWESRGWRVLARVWAGAYNDGFIHAGNLAYMGILALFPFFVTVGAIFSLLGEQGQREVTVHNLLLALPPIVTAVLEPVAQNVILARSGWLLWAGGIVGLWTVGSLVETIRDILRRAYGTKLTHAFWRYRLISTGVIVAAVVLLLFALLAQILLSAAQQVVSTRFPWLNDLIDLLNLSMFVPPVIIYASLFMLFYTLTPSRYRTKQYPKWPGALFVTAWWVGVSAALPWVLRSFFKYDLTYGSLAGVMIALFFFWLVGLGLVIGAELNAALAESPEERNVIGQSDDRAQHGQAAQ